MFHFIIARTDRWEDKSNINILGNSVRFKAYDNIAGSTIGCTERIVMKNAIEVSL